MRPAAGVLLPAHDRSPQTSTGWGLAGRAGEAANGRARGLWLQFRLLRRWLALLLRIAQLFRDAGDKLWEIKPVCWTGGIVKCTPF